MKEKKCRVCRCSYQPNKPLQQVCSVSCAIELANKKKVSLKRTADRLERAETRKRKEDIKTRAEWLREAQIAVNAYIRERDKNQPCISCGCILQGELLGGGFDAGHYRSRGSAPHLRFDLRNIHGQCKRCNRYLSGNVNNFRDGLLHRIGIESLLALESDNTPRKWSIDDLKEIKALYKRKLKELKDG